MSLGRRLIFVGAAMAATCAAQAAPPAPPPDARADLPAVIDEGLNYSKVMQTAEYLFDRIGPRLTNTR